MQTSALLDGIPWYRLTPEQVATVLRTALDAPGIDLVEVPVDYSEDDRIITDEIPRLSAAIEKP